MNNIIQHIDKDGFYWFEYNMGPITLISFTLSDLIKRMLLNNVPLN